MLIAAAIILKLALWACFVLFALMTSAPTKPPIRFCWTAIALAVVCLAGSSFAIFLACGVGWMIVGLLVDFLVFALIANGGSLPWPFWIIWLAFLIIGVKLI